MARALVFAAALAPMSIWLLTDGRLARPGEAALWACLCGVLAASVPGRWVKGAVLGQVLLLPLTLGWVGAVAVTGMGPSTASLGSASKGAYREVLTASHVVLQDGRFQLVAAASVFLLILAALNLKRVSVHGQGSRSGVVFLVALLPASASVLDAGGFRSIAQLVGPEARMGVVWLSHLEMAKETGRIFVDQMAKPADVQPVYERSVAQAVPVFSALPGVGIFIVGESLRADALMDPARGPWSAALARRLEQGLGMRLPDACAAGNGTFTALPRLLTAVDVADEMGAATAPTLLAWAKAAGARTAYINNHEIWVVPEAGHDFTQKISSMDMNTYDEVAIDAMSDFLKRTKASSRAVLVHLYGQHFFYEQRYPATLFPAESNSLGTDALLELRYQRAAEYGAKVLLQAAQTLDEETVPAFLVFTSDHGENLPSDGSGKRYHAGPTSSIKDSLVPAIVLWNRAFAETGRWQVLGSLLEGPGVIAHRDVAEAWLALFGKPGPLRGTERPQTWGALQPGVRAGAVNCADLRL